MNETSERSSFLWSVHSYTNEYIRFADTKAAVVIGWSGGMTGLMLSSKAHHFFFFEHWTGFSSCELIPTLLGVMSLIGFLCLAAGFVAAVRVVHPRLWRPKGQETKKGIIFWDAVLQCGNAAEYEAQIKNAQSQGLSNAVASHVVELARVSHDKYWWIQVAIWATFGGTLLSAIVLLVTV